MCFRFFNVYVNNNYNNLRNEGELKMSYKENCGFRKIGCCNFKEEDCKPKAINDTKDNIDFNLFCDLYTVEWTSKGVKKEMDSIKFKLKNEVKSKVTKKKIKEMRKLEKENKLNNDVIEYKKHLLRIKDYDEGLNILRKAYRYLKRTKK